MPCAENNTIVYPCPSCGARLHCKSIAYSHFSWIERILSMSHAQSHRSRCRDGMNRSRNEGMKRNEMKKSKKRRRQFDSLTTYTRVSRNTMHACEPIVRVYKISLCIASAIIWQISAWQKKSSRNTIIDRTEWANQEEQTQNKSATTSTKRHKQGTIFLFSFNFKKINYF